MSHPRPHGTLQFPIQHAPAVGSGALHSSTLPALNATVMKDFYLLCEEGEKKKTLHLVAGLFSRTALSMLAPKETILGL